MTSDDEDIPLSTIYEMIGSLPDLVQAQIMKYQRIAEQNRPTRRKINAEFQSCNNTNANTRESRGMATLPFFY